MNYKRKENIMSEQINGYVGLDLSKLYDQDSDLTEIAKNGEIAKLKNLDYLKEVLKTGKPIVTKDYLEVERYTVVKVCEAYNQRNDSGVLEIFVINDTPTFEDISIDFDANGYTSISLYGVGLTAIV